MLLIFIIDESTNIYLFVLDGVEAVADPNMMLSVKCEKT